MIFMFFLNNFIVENFKMIRQTIPQYTTLIFSSSLTKKDIRNKNVQIASTLWVKKEDTKLVVLTRPNVNWFSKLFHCQTNVKSATNSHSNIPPHLNYVATLPCEMSMFKNQKSLFLHHLVNRTQFVRWAGTRKVKPICILRKQETLSGSGSNICTKN